MKRSILWLLGLLLLCGCAFFDGAQPESLMPSSFSSADESILETAPYRVLTAEDARVKMQEEGVVVLDVRTASEYAQGHLFGALLLPNEEIGTEPPAALPDRDAVVLVYCRSGNRSRQAAEKLLAMGYTEVYDFGGINNWPWPDELVTDPS